MANTRPLPDCIFYLCVFFLSRFFLCEPVSFRHGSPNYNYNFDASLERTHIRLDVHILVRHAYLRFYELFTSEQCCNVHTNPSTTTYNNNNNETMIDMPSNDAFQLTLPRCQGEDYSRILAKLEISLKE